ncbi:MAG TPA: sulfite exporter TauE/SafE family protein [Terriglobales bacterium]|nr:sulfite exporter TauE/SafE family protein [Terriglobales bacterium]
MPQIVIGVMGVSLWDLVLGVGVGLAAGFLNAMASGGSAVALPILMLIGLDPVVANATNRLPVLIGAVAAAEGFQRKKTIPWSLTVKVGVPVTIGAVIGAGLAEAIPGRDFALIVTAAMLVALVLVLSRLKQAIDSAVPRRVHYGPRHVALFLLIGTWVGFITIDGATYMLLALVLGLGLPLVNANAVKIVVAIPMMAVALTVFTIKGSVDWSLGAMMCVGGAAGGHLGARFATSESGRKWIFYLLVAVILAELVHLTLHYVFRTY